ncbi:hypothetical protein ACQ4PT_071254 [Festuca glaucescens]
MEETSESDSGSAPERSARGTKRKRVTEPRDRDSAGSGSDSSGSPFRRPKAPLMPICTKEDGTVLYGFTDDQDVMDRYHDDMQKYIKKRDRHKRMLTLAPSSVTERRTFKETESVLKYAESVLSLSAYLDGKMINHCTGIVVEVDAFRNSAIILTSTWLFCTKKPLDDWTKKEYATEAKCGTGGGVLDAGGKIVGMLFYKLPLVAFIPSSLILKCSTMWQHFRQLARPQLGLKLRTLAFLDIPRIELMSRKFSISSGLIVGEISAKCDAEKLGIRAGDIIFSCQKEHVSSIVQLEHVLLGVGEEHLQKSNDLSSKVEVETMKMLRQKETRERKGPQQLHVKQSHEECEVISIHDFFVMVIRYLARRYLGFLLYTLKNGSLPLK